VNTHLTQRAAAWQEPDTRFIQIPRGLIRMTSPREYQLIAALLAYRWTPESKIFPSVKTLAAEMGCTPRTVQRTVAALEARGWLVREYQYRPDGSQRSSTYHLAGELLSMMTDSVDARASEPRQTPLTRGAGRTRYPERQTPKTGRERGHGPGSGLLVRRNGVICRE
jgi:DNA-binding transcriptional MocR family regulator